MTLAYNNMDMKHNKNAFEAFKIKAKLDKNKKHMIEVVVDRLVIKPEVRSRLTDSIETAVSLSGRPGR